ncbi:MAG TPA: HEAT repeat domain-containing protein [Polyangia bacterium]|nr:HEAT repeat domain-containing protein [Polyangia bacterium]
MNRARLAALLLAALVAPACEDGSHGDIADEINILVRRNDQLVPPAMDRLAAFRRAAIPQMETALHTAAPAGRLHLIAAMARIGDAEAVPILRHAALFDVAPEVRGAGEAVLSRWAADPSDSGRAARAGAALVEVARRRAAGEGPLLYGDAGLPGVPSTVGAPDPISPSSPR